MMLRGSSGGNDPDGVAFGHWIVWSAGEQEPSGLAADADADADFDLILAFVKIVGINRSTSNNWIRK